MDIIKKIIKQTISNNTKGISIENTMLNDCIAKLKEWDLVKTEDTVELLSSMYCPVCCIYNHRVFSVYGNDKRFPCLSKMPDFLLKKQCPECDFSFTYSVYFSDVKSKKELNKDIKFSNRPFIDDSPRDVIKHREKLAKENAEFEQLQDEFEWITDNLPDIAPKSLSGYKRMKNSNSKNYQNIVSKAKEKGFMIK